MLQTQLTNICILKPIDQKLQSCFNIVLFQHSIFLICKSRISISKSFRKSIQRARDMQNHIVLYFSLAKDIFSKDRIPQDNGR